MFAPKVAGSWWLHEATAHLDLDWWLTFSSAASLLGSPGQGAYAAANSWVDGLVAYRRSRGLPAIGINWGPWAEVGRAQFFADLGFSMITSELGLAAMQQVLAADRCRTGVFSLDARQWFQSFPAARGVVAVRQAGRVGDDRAARRRPDPRRTRRRRARRAPCPARLSDRQRDPGRFCRSIEPLDHDQPMESLGLDSLMALELRNRLEASLGITLPVALVWAYPTISALAECPVRADGLRARRLNGRRRLSAELKRLSDDEDGPTGRSRRCQRTRSQDGSSRVMTSLAERAAQLSPQAREVLARELIRVGHRVPRRCRRRTGGGGGDRVPFPRRCGWAGEFLAVVGQRRGCDQRGAGGSLGCR